MPDDFQKDGELAIIAHAPHLVRILRIINKYRPFPNDTRVRLFPVPTQGADGKREYAMMEVSGTLYYSNVTHNATMEPYPYEISSTRENDQSSPENKAL